VVSIVDAALGGTPWRQALAAYFFTSSTSFANPAITVGRMFSDTFAGIAPASVPLYVAMQLVGGLVAVLLVQALYPRKAPSAAVPAVESEETLIAPGRRA
jgi:glycerol uptake facilitator-like aquaporin